MTARTASDRVSVTEENTITESGSSTQRDYGVALACVQKSKLRWGKTTGVTVTYTVDAFVCFRTCSQITPLQPDTIKCVFQREY